MNSHCKYNFVPIIVLLNSISIYAMELPDYEKGKSKQKMNQEIIEIEKADACSICSEKIPTKSDDLLATFCCRKLICDICAEHSIKKSKRSSTIFSNISPCPFCKNQFKIGKAIFKYNTIFDAIRDGNQAAVKRKFLNKELLINLEGEDNNGDTPLILATKLGHIHIVEDLIDRGARLFHRVKDDYSALHYAALNGRDSIIVYFLTHAFNSAHISDNPDKKEFEDVNKTNVLGETPLICACQNGHLTTIQTLLNFRADLKKKNINNEDVFDIARKHDDTKLREEMLALLNKKG